MNGHPKPKVLLVDDSEICRDTARMMMEEAGFEVVTLDSPFGFGKTLLKERPDVALVDVAMPALQGDQLVHLARPLGARQRCQILLFSAQPEERLAELTHRCGADGYIKKSEDWPAIIRAIRSFRGR